MQTKIAVDDAKRVLKNYHSIKLDIEGFNKELNLLCDRLNQSDSFAEFHAIVDDIIKTEKDLDKFLVNEGLDNNLKNILLRDIQDKPELRSLYNVLIFNQIYTNNIIENKQRLSYIRLKDELDDIEKYKIAEDFLKSILVLKPITELIERQKDHFKRELDSSNSPEQITDIEGQIYEQDHQFLEAYQTLIHFPEDEIIAGAIIKFIETNQHFKTIMETFDFAESLEDDVLDARARVYESQSIRPN